LFAHNRGDGLQPDRPGVVPGQHTQYAAVHLGEAAPVHAEPHQGIGGGLSRYHIAAARLGHVPGAPQEPVRYAGRAP
jgi:hypothetical protein